MYKTSRKAASRQQLLVLGVLVIGVILLVSALLQPASSEPPGWVAVNGQVEQLLKEHQSFDAAGEKGAVKAQETQTTEGTDQPGGKLSDAGNVQTGGKKPEDETSAAGKQVTEAVGKLDINQATAEQLDALPGIGAVKAQTIVSDREKSGQFGSVNDLLRVKGIGPKLLEKIKDSIVAQP
ncbi:ComEA family DNA-binding protein [Paenibacillus solisilvae]|uniref:ComEA family DNA-binding protein n=1 Tax=Paenibacillus solisilvae TaxID=2486751 RepID=A0ABW0W4W6_9BACL